MAMTMTQKIMAAHVGKTEVKAGDFIYADLDIVLGNDITAPLAIDECEKAGYNGVFDKSKIALVPDHFTPNKDIKTAEQCKKLRAFAFNHDIDNYFEVGQAGIEHALLPEKGLIKPGQVIIGADSHTCTFGALGAFSTGIGSTDMAAGMVKGKAWFRVPEAIKVTLNGKLNSMCSGKDVILSLIGMIGVDGARYKSLEFCGEGIKNLTIDDRFTISNMVIEAGAKNGIFPVDDITKKYLKEVDVKDHYTIYRADSDATYVQEIVMNLGDIEPVVAKPHLPENIDLAKNLSDVRVDQVIIGSCTNGRISDLKAAYKVLKGKKVASHIRLIIIPATQKIYLEAIERGYISEFIRAGAVVSPPTCGPCLGGHMGVLGKDEVAIATTNRNFVGRMGHPESFVYLSNPQVAAASAIAGYISLPNRSRGTF